MKKKQHKKISVAKQSTQEVIVRIQSDTSLPRPTEQDLYEPMKEGKKLTIPKTWISESQILKMVEKTPKQFVYRRKGKGGQIFDYVTGNYITKVLNYTFGWNWDFEIVSFQIQGGQVHVLGKLTIRGTNSQDTITKTQFGRADIKHLKGTKEPMDLGNDLKAAATDALKKCASLFGIASDIYGKAEYKEETNYDPNFSVETNLPQIESPTTKESKEICRGVSGKGCAYGNDAEPLGIATLTYSKKVYGKPLCKECQKDAKAK